VALRTAGELLAVAILIATDRTTDLRLDAAERAQMSEALGHLETAQDRLRADNTLPTGRRQPTASQFVSQVNAMDAIDKNHVFGAAVIYDVMDIMDDLADLFLAAQPSRDTTLSPESEALF
jgi:hypothetical protein